MAKATQPRGCNPGGSSLHSATLVKFKKCQFSIFKLHFQSRYLFSYASRSMHDEMAFLMTSSLFFMFSSRSVILVGIDVTW